MFEKVQGLLRSLLKYEYAKVGLYYVIANIIGQGIVLLSSAFFTRMMDKNAYGLVSTYSTWVLVLNTFICLNLFITVRNAYIDYKDDYDKYTSAVLLLSVFAGVCFTIAMAIINVVLRVNITIEEVLLACVHAIALNVINFKLAVQSMQNQYQARIALMIAPNWVHTILSLVFMLLFTGNLYYAKIFGNAFGLLGFAIACMIVTFKKYKPTIDRNYWRYSLQISLPSIFNTFSELILMQSDRLMLTFFAGADETAEYSIVYNVASIIVVIYQAINGAWTPWFFDKAVHKDYKATKKCQTYYMGIFTVFSYGMMTVSPELIKLISPPTYWGSIKYAGAIVVASYLIFLYTFFSSYLLYKKCTGKIARNTIIAAGVNLVLNNLLIPVHKAEGAVVATVVSYLLLFLLHYFSIGRKGKRYFSIASMWLNIAAMVGCSMIFWGLRDYCIVRYLIFVVTVCTFIAIFKRKEIN